MTTETLDRWALEARNKKRVEAERYECLYTVAGEAAAHLGNGWTARRVEASYDGVSPYNTELVNQALGYTVNVSVDHNYFEGKVDVSGDYDLGPREYGVSIPYNTTRPRIRVSLERGGKVLASEITRRFLPEYAAIVFYLNERIRETREYRELHGGITSRLEKIAGAGVKSDDYNKFHVCSTNYQRRIEVHVSNGVVDIQLSNLSEAVATKVLEIVKLSTLTGGSK
jgi:hypothetical protein